MSYLFCSKKKFPLEKLSRLGGERGLNNLLVLFDVFLQHPDWLHKKIAEKNDVLKQENTIII